MTVIVTKIAKLLAGKAVNWAASMLLAVGVVLPANLSDQATVGVAVVIAVVLQVAYQLGAALVERFWPGFAASRISTIRPARVADRR